MSRFETDVVVVGGGLAGLVSASYVARAGHSVTVVERKARLGGRAGTDEREGFLFNQGAHAVFRDGAAAEVLADLDIRLSGSQPDVAGLVVFEDRPAILPTGTMSMLRTKALGFREKVEVGRLLGAVPRFDPRPMAATSVAEWLDDATTYRRSRDLIEALIRLSTYVNDPDLLSAEVAVSQLQLALGGGVLYVDGGWQSLVDQLAATEGLRIETGTTIDDLPDVPAVIIATGGPDLAGSLLGHDFPSGPAAIASCIDLGLSRAPESNFVLGGDVPYYFSNHSAAARLSSKGTWYSALIEYVPTGADPDPTALREFATYAGVRGGDVIVERPLHRMKAVSAIATAETGGTSGRPTATATGHPNVFIAGDWVGPTGHLADASAASARHAANQAIATLESRRITRSP